MESVKWLYRLPDPMLSFGRTCGRFLSCHAVGFLVCWFAGEEILFTFLYVQIRTKMRLIQVVRD
jgi:hypothetical protein